MITRFQLGGYQGQQLWRSIVAGLVTAIVGAALVLTPLGTTFERTFGLDWLFKMRGARPRAGRSRRRRDQQPDRTGLGFDQAAA